MAEHSQIFCQGYDISQSAAIVCVHVVSEKFPILCAVRDESIHAADSGWQFHCGIKDHDEAVGKVWAVKNVIQHDESVGQIIDSPPRSSFVREAAAAEWKRRKY